VIAGGKLAVVLGIETSNLFDCKLTPQAGDPTCDEAYIESQLDHYYDLGVRAIFPVHKYDNKFTPGDGDRAFIELGNFANSGHWSNFTLDCPDPQVGGFDSGDVNFGGLNMPRDVYDSPAPIDNSKFATAPLNTTGMYLSEIGEPPLVGPYCQNATLTAARRAHDRPDDGARHDHRGRPPPAVVLRPRLRAAAGRRLPGHRQPRAQQRRPALRARRRVDDRLRRLPRRRSPARRCRASRTRSSSSRTTAATRPRASASTSTASPAPAARASATACADPADRPDHVSLHLVRRRHRVHAAGGRQPHARLQHRGPRAHRPAARADRGRPARRRRRGGHRAAVPLGRGLHPHVGAAEQRAAELGG
jgi:hypothetical protein